MKTLLFLWFVFRRRFTRSIEVLGYIDGACAFPTDADGIAVPLYGAPLPAYYVASASAVSVVPDPTTQPKGNPQ